jgi:hypothetical protein
MPERNYFNFVHVDAECFDRELSCAGKSNSSGALAAGLSCNNRPRVAASERFE